MEKLLNSIEELKKSKVKNLVNKRIKEFKENENLFSELCFCLLTANFNAERSIKIQSKIGNGFCSLSQSNLAKRLKQLGHRFPNARAKYIVEARKHERELRNNISAGSSCSRKNENNMGGLINHKFDKAQSLQKLKQSSQKLLRKNETELREWLVKNIKGLGMKEASHFLRNIGFENYAIIDFHIVDLLAKYKLIKKPKALTKKKYLEIENLLKQISEKSGLSLAELDLYLWYMETGKVLK